MTPCDVGCHVMCCQDCDCDCHDRFAEPVTHPSGVRWEPTDYRPIDQTEYQRFAAERGPNSQ